MKTETKNLIFKTLFFVQKIKTERIIKRIFIKSIPIQYLDLISAG